ncbi:tRNA (guanosine(46)-N7)-methyltransferase TrmB [Adhaeretor mobilis]|uniref:tRNA (guanine-N(7)-)-methyltransferase n=1 Tax=Adhaeretor mobilis TaxID=1930276 RepID=A0A517MYL6_9BACT|nr:tRNA (guanosine(46)-N7)-methyltransferase TrmB [Adhaeretor mobilis]QDS99982.1 tRNA (guanine-N(7)-)-methyltransferase [Adhaeretor mobilis]
MGRRALKKLDPKIDLSGHFRTVEELPAPWNPAELFAKEQPLEVEMGSGKGLFLQTASGVCPEHNFLGVEVRQKYALHAAARLARGSRTNGMAVYGDGLRMFRECIPSASLAAVHVYFPDPWWKTRHRKRRILNEAFLNDIVRTLLPDGRLHFWTDVQRYFDATLELIAEKIALEGPVDVNEKPAEHDLDYRTHFERRTRLNDEPVYRAEFVKR